MKIFTKMLAVTSLSMLAFSSNAMCMNGQNTGFNGTNFFLQYDVNVSRPQNVSQSFTQAFRRQSQNNMQNIRNQRSTIQNNTNSINDHNERGVMHLSVVTDNRSLTFYNTLQMFNDMFRATQARMRPENMFSNDQQ